MTAVAHAADATQELVGGRYRVESVIGSGGLSTVYRAHDQALGRDVAIKWLTPGPDRPTHEGSELAILAGLDHHNLITVLDAGTHTDAAGREVRYIVMPLVRGMNLQERLHGSRIAARNIAEIGYDLAEALEYIHAHGVVHRDVKPSNILLVDYGNDAARARAKLTDFGIAVAPGMERLTADGTTTGTAAYLSPEQAAGEPVGPPTDVYAAGLVLLQCFTRTIEFPGTVVESAIARLSRQPRIPDYLPERWRSLLTAMTARDPRDRPPGRELVSALRQVALAESGRHKEQRCVLPLGRRGRRRRHGPADSQRGPASRHGDGRTAARLRDLGGQRARRGPHLGRVALRRRGGGDRAPGRPDRAAGSAR